MPNGARTNTIQATTKHGPSHVLLAQQTEEREKSKVCDRYNQESIAQKFV